MKITSQPPVENPTPSTIPSASVDQVKTGKELVVVSLDIRKNTPDARVENLNFNISQTIPNRSMLYIDERLASDQFTLHSQSLFEKNCDQIVGRLGQTENRVSGLENGVKDFGNAVSKSLGNLDGNLGNLDGNLGNLGGSVHDTNDRAKILLSLLKQQHEISDKKLQNNPKQITELLVENKSLKLTEENKNSTPSQTQPPVPPKNSSQVSLVDQASGTSTPKTISRTSSESLMPSTKTTANAAGNDTRRTTPNNSQVNLTTPTTINNTQQTRDTIKHPVEKTRKSFTNFSKNLLNKIKHSGKDNSSSTTRAAPSERLNKTPVKNRVSAFGNKVKNFSPTTFFKNLHKPKTQ